MGCKILTKLQGQNKDGDLMNSFIYCELNLRLISENITPYVPKEGKRFINVMVIIK
jgi:hypothetical protein